LGKSVEEMIMLATYRATRLAGWTLGKENLESSTRDFDAVVEMKTLITKRVTPNPKLNHAPIVRI